MKKRLPFILNLIILLLLPLFSVAQNNALAFDGSNVYAYSNSTVNLSGSAITLETWVYVTAFQATSPYISGLVGVGTGAYLRLGDANIPNGNKVQFVLNFGGTESKLTSNSILKTGHWYHIAGTYDGANMNLFINGIKDTFKAQTGSFTANDKIFVGYQDVGFGPDRFLYGKLDEVRVWNTAIIQSGIVGTMYADLGTAGSLKVYYKLNETGTTTTLTDASGNSHTATAVGISSGKWVPSRAFTGPKECLNFHDTNDFAKMDAPATTVTDNFTLSAWFNASAIPTSGFSAVVYNGTDGGGYGFGIDSSGKLVALFGAIQWINTPQTISTGQWYYVTLRRTNGLTEVLVDGKVLDGVTFGSSSTTAPATPVSRFTVANMYMTDNSSLRGNSFNGYVDEVRVYKAALTDAQIRETMNRTVNNNDSNLEEYYNFDNTSGTQAQSFNFGSTLHSLFLQNMTDADWVASTAFNTWLDTGDTANTSWNNAANWSLGQVPTSSDNIGIPSYTAGNNPNDNLFNINVNTFVVEQGTTLTVDGSFLTTNANAYNYGIITGTGSITSNSFFTNGGNVNVNTFLVSSGASAIIDSGKQMTLSTLTNNGTFTVNSDATSSGSLIVSGTSTGNVTYNRYLTSGTSSKWHLISAPIGSQSINTFVTTTANNIAIGGTGNVNYSVTPYNNTVVKNNPAVWTHWTTSSGSNPVSAAGNFVAGKGYEILTTADGTVNFTGTVATGNVSVAITKPASNNAWNLIGNPYPSSIFANSNADATNNFITVNTSALDASYQAIYLWNPTTSLYDLINQASPATYIAPGQGFFVKSVAGGATVNFTTAMRTNQPSVAFQRPATQPAPSITLIADNGSAVKTTAIKYIGGMSLGLDPGYDAGRFGGVSTNFAIYSHLVNDNGVAFALQVLPDNVYDATIIPIGIDAKAGTQITFKAGASNLPIGKKVFLEDRLLGLFNEINTSNKSYVVSLSKDTNGIGRFFLHTLDNLSTLGLNDFSKLNFSIIAQPKLNRIRVIGNIEAPGKLGIYDTLGRLIKSLNLSTASDQNISVSNMAKGIYFVKVKSPKANFSTKIAWY